MNPLDRRSAPGYGILGLLLIGGVMLGGWIRSRPRMVASHLLPEDGVLYPEVEDVLGTFADHMGCSRQQARDRLLLPDRLLAALDRPLQHHQYGEADLAEQAAVLAQGIVKNHAFDDGNKRTALVVAINFLKLNGLVLPDAVSQAERQNWMLQLERTQSFDSLARRLRDLVQPIP